MDDMIYPRGYITTGVAMPLMTRVKIVPKIPGKAGQMFAIEVSEVIH